MPARLVFGTMRGVMGKPDKVILLRTTGLGVTLSADAAKLPHRIKVLNWGDNPNCHGKRVNVGPLFVKCLGADTYPYRKVALDFEHNTFPGTPAYKESQEPRPVAGFGTIEAVEGDGVYLAMSSWTPEGERMAAHYADVSAGAVTDKEGNLIAVSSVALCRAGSVDGMDFVEAPLSGGISSALSGIANSREILIVALAAAFDESKHPRTEDGKWTDGGGSIDDKTSKAERAIDAAKNRTASSDELARINPWDDEKTRKMKLRLAKMRAGNDTIRQDIAQRKAGIVRKKQDIAALRKELAEKYGIKNP